MRKVIFFLYFIVLVSAVSLDKLQDLIVDKKYDVNGVFYKYDFANVEPAWDFVYVSNNVYYQLKGVKATSNNIFGWKIIDTVVVPSPSFYFVYLSDVDEDNETKYDWLALNKANSSINKLVGSTSQGYFSWSENLSKLSFSFSEGDKKVTFHKSINGGTSLSDAKLPKFPDLPDRLLDINDTTVDDVKDSNDDNDKGKEDDKSDDKDKEDDKSDGNTNNKCTQFVGEEISSCTKYYEEAEKFPQTPACNGNISCMRYYTETQNLKDCVSFIVDSSSAPSPGQCRKWQP